MATPVEADDEEPVLLIPYPTTEEVPAPLASPFEPLPEVAPSSPSSAGSLNIPGLADIEFAPLSCCNCCGSQCGQSSHFCNECQDMGRYGRFLRSIYRGICCPDACYEPCWTPLADSAFFTNSVRPVNQQRFRWDFAEDMRNPDRSEYFWARADGSGLGPTPVTDSWFRGLDYDELSHTIEAAHGPIGIWFEYTYRALDTDTGHFAGFGDMSIGTKTLLFDTELVQIASQFRTYIPQGSSREGLGTGHTSLEPSLIAGLKLSPKSYLQAEVAEWIPLGGDSVYAGALLRYGFAYNRTIFQPHPSIPIISTSEITGWHFQDGQFTDSSSGDMRPSSGGDYVHGSTGLRLFICDRVDFGTSASMPLTGGSWSETWLRTELRVRF
ncbi:hypothetical protein [Aeoliella mucimassa]|nr:hypothetical protein [Aeoliella mucimassa]